MHTQEANEHSIKNEERREVKPQAKRSGANFVQYGPIETVTFAEGNL